MADTFGLIDKKVGFTKVEIDGDDGLLVVFSDKTTTAYVAEELLELRPYRETVDERPATHN
jgi:hypothetical protein